MSRSVVLRLLMSLLVPLSLVAMAAPGCTSPLDRPCPFPGETYWICTALVQERSTPSCSCETGPRETTDWVCASDAFTAQNAMEYLVNVREGSIVLRHMGCRDTGTPYPQASEPEFVAQRLCDAAAGDDACVRCAKSACCDEVDACGEDPRCLCLVECLSGGNAVSTCTLPENCGPADGVAAEAASCLDDACQAQCPTLGALGSAWTSGIDGQAR